jgi:hypothetical protein
MYGSGMMDKTMMYDAAGWHEIWYMKKVMNPKGNAPRFQS